MKFNSEKQPSLVRFKNQPKLSGSDIDKNRDDRRSMLIPHVDNFLSTDDMFKGREVEVEFSHQGISSLVCFVEVGNEKYVLKVALSDTVPEGSEALFLNTWKSTGVSTPYIFKEGNIAGRAYLLMECIDAPTAGEKCKDNKTEKDNINFEAGKILKQMHKSESTGFGKVVDGKGEFDSFKEWIDHPNMKNRVTYIEENNLLIQVSENFSKMRDVLVDYVGDSNISSYCHFDYSTGHLFATEPLTVFDPTPIFNNGYIDLGRTLVNYIAASGTYPKKLLDGYMEGSVLNEKVLQASIYLNIVYKLPYQHQKERLNNIKNFQDYLIQQESSVAK